MNKVCIYTYLYTPLYIFVYVVYKCMYFYIWAVSAPKERQPIIRLTEYDSGYDSVKKWLSAEEAESSVIFNKVVEPFHKTAAKMISLSVCLMDFWVNRGKVRRSGLVNQSHQLVWLEEGEWLPGRMTLEAAGRSGLFGVFCQKPRSRAYHSSSETVVRGQGIISSNLKRGNLGQI